MTLESFLNSLHHQTIEQTYSVLDYDYHAEMLHEQAARNIAGKSWNLERSLQEYGERRQRFLNHFEWYEKAPSHSSILRLFNQVNTFYAEDWAIGRLAAKPEMFLKECGRLILYRQGKRSGFRTSDISFGIRKNIDFMDPYKQFKLLRGIAPALIDQASNMWARVIESGPLNSNCALLLAMALIAIHPFSDGNGRLARVAYAWLMRRWGLGEYWLAEDDTGEFLRTGVGIKSTEHCMSMLILELCGGYNRIDFGYGAVRSEREDKQAAISLESHLRDLLHSYPGICDGTAFTLLHGHLLKEGHFTAQSPRFEALRKVIR